MEFNEMLIQMVHDSPCIYDSGSKLYKDQKRKENVWKNISECTGQSVENCMKRWKSLQDRFAKEKRKIENARKSGAAAENLQIWEHYEALKFLQDHKMTVGNFSRPSTPVVDFTQDEPVPEQEEITLEEVEEDIATPPSTSLPSTSRQGMKRKRSDRLDFQESICSMLRQNTESISKLTASNTGQDDEFTGFGNFVACSLRSLPKKGPRGHVCNYRASVITMS